MSQISCWEVPGQNQHVYAGKLHRYSCFLPTEEQGSSHCNGWNSPASLVPGKGQSRLFSNGINKLNSENSVNDHSSRILLSVEENVWVHMYPWSSPSAESTQFSSLVSLDLWKWASWFDFPYSGFLTCSSSALLRNICAWIVSHTSIAEHSCPSMPGNSDAEPSALGSLLSQEEPDRYWISVPWWLHGLLEVPSCKAAAARSQGWCSTQWFLHTSHDMSTEQERSGYTQGLWVVYQWSFCILGCQYLGMMRTFLYHTPLRQYRDTWHMVYIWPFLKTRWIGVLGILL